MRKIVYKFLDEMFRENPIIKSSYSVKGTSHNRDVVRFVDSKGNCIFEYHTYMDGNHSDNMSAELLGKIINYFDVHRIMARAYVLDWCRENYIKD